MNTGASTIFIIPLLFSRSAFRHLVVADYLSPVKGQENIAEIIIHVRSTWFLFFGHSPCSLA